MGSSSSQSGRGVLERCYPVRHFVLSLTLTLGFRLRSPAPAPGRLPFVAWVRAMKAAANSWGPRAEIVGGALTSVSRELQGRVPQSVGEWQDQLRLASRDSCKPAQLWSS